MTNPYRGKPDHCFWSRAMTNVAAWQVDPVVRGGKIEADEKVATMGSCFAQHLAKHIRASGLNYFVPEDAPAELTALDRHRLNYGVFSARYGNVYTVRQALQLFRRAFGMFAPQEFAWRRGDRWVDALRPQIEPDGYASKEAVKEASDRHLAHVRRIFSESDWLVFTLGLTEAWQSRHDGTIYPIAPGVAGGTFDPELHSFVNFTADEVKADLFQLIEEIARINPRMKILLTVSPVPLIATFEDRHVWVSTTISKAALRVAADAAERRYERVIYFPSYEIITSPAAQGRYFADDLREVLDLGVKHVMRVFSKHFLAEASEKRPATMSSIPSRADAAQSDTGEDDIVCDEEVIEAAMRAALR